MSKPSSSMPADPKRTWAAPRLLKEAFVAVAAVAILAVGLSKVVQRFGIGRARDAVAADQLDGAAAPVFKLPARGGGELDLSAMRGKLVLVNFWATWCPPCRDEMPSLARLAEQFDRGSFEVAAVSVDESWAPVEKFFPQPQAPFRVALDQGAKTSLAYGTSKFPESYLIDRDGKLRLKFVGPRNWMDPNVAALLESWGAKRKRF